MVEVGLYQYTTNLTNFLKNLTKHTTLLLFIYLSYQIPEQVFWPFLMLSQYLADESAGNISPDKLNFIESTRITLLCSDRM